MKKLKKELIIQKNKLLNLCWITNLKNTSLNLKKKIKNFIKNKIIKIDLIVTIM